MASDDPGPRALETLDRILREKPHVDGHLFAEVTEHLARMRDLMIERQGGHPTPPERRRLEHVNAVISVVLAGHFPLGSVPWHEIELARGWLADALQPS